MRPLVAGNWKMNGLRAALSEVTTLAQMHPTPSCDVLICPPATLLAPMAEVAAGTSVAVGGQDCHAAASGAHTGDIAAEMIADAGGTAVIVGHSERRADHGEDDATVRAKAEAAIRAGLTAIICVGETEAERDAGRTLDVVLGQLAGSLPEGSLGASVVIAYEPVWAIGTGRVPELSDITEVHDALRADLAKHMPEAEAALVRLLYGGSVKPGNAAEIFGIENVNGGLVGGASLKASDFGQIVAAAG
ncbi:triose-phosphate isomerase [Pontivivens ytuae]|uniref:Triosephosphate isomerase n=1 Tax=Pontivivens ytuae TaxID=2789856 RepID=A0A7S9QE94_9RHOB|nr:triose-phosphate isomerase [Pontivivens ytuae]QPH56088.1 triose-phosphate isomerase [Pontivivens ytuae]